MYPPTRNPFDTTVHALLVLMVLGLVVVGISLVLAETHAMIGGGLLLSGVLLGAIDFSLSRKV